MNQRQEKDTLVAFDKQVQTTVVNVLKKFFPLDIQANKLDEDLLWTILLYAAARRTTVEAACQALVKTPSANRVREHLNAQFGEQTINIQEMEKQFNQAFLAVLPKKVRRELATSKWEVAVDLTDICYYGKTDDDDRQIRRSVAKKGTTHFYSYATLSMINRQQRYTVAMTLVTAGESMVEVVKRLLEALKQLGIKIKMSYWDKAFGVIEVMRYLKNKAVPYIIAVAQRGGAGGIKKLCRGRKSGRCRYRFKSAKAGSFTASVAVVCKYSKNKYKRRGVRYFCYAVNRIGRMKAGQVFSRYRRRFAIESGYRQLHQVQIKTAMKNAVVRMLFIGLAILIVNVYVLLRRMVVTKSEYGTRRRWIALTLEMVVREIERYIEELLQLNRVLYCKNTSLYQSFQSFVIY